jgi:AbrB family looped-hinge helix DNA binding protein
LGSTTVTSKGQVTSPKAVRDQLGVGDRGRVVFTIEPDGVVRVRALKYPTARSLAGVAGKLPKAPTGDPREIAREERALRRGK